MRSPQSTPPLKVMLKLEHCPVEMEIDTGAAISLVSETTIEELWKEKPALSPSQVRLRSYSGEPIPVVGGVEVNIVYKQQSARLLLLVVQGGGPSLLGRNWLSQLKLDWHEIHRPLHFKHCWTNMIQCFMRAWEPSRISKPDLCRSGGKATILQGQVGTICKARPISYS